MTTRLEDELSLPHLEDILKLERQSVEAEESARLAEVAKELDELRGEDPTTADSFESALTKAHRIEAELADHAGFRQHDIEMDDIAKEAMESYHEFKDLALNCTPAHAGKIAETAANMLRIAMEAKNSKSEKKLRMWRLQIDQARLLRDLERDRGLDEGTIDNEEAIRIERNKLLKEIQSTFANET